MGNNTKEKVSPDVSPNRLTAAFQKVSHKLKDKRWNKIQLDKQHQQFESEIRLWLCETLNYWQEKYKFTTQKRLFMLIQRAELKTKYYMHSFYL